MKQVEQEKTDIITDHLYTEADFDGIQAAPMLIIGKHARPKYILQQDMMADKFKEVVQGELGDIVVPSVIDFVSRSIVSRMHQREGLNGIAYANRRYRLPHPQEVPNRSILYVLRACLNAPRGTGTIDQNHTAVLAYGSPSGELGNITVVGEFRKDEEKALWEGASELVGHDATPNPNDMRAATILGFDRDILKNQHLGAIRVGMKRDIGIATGDVAVKARTTAIINTSPSSGFDQDIVDALREAVYMNTQMDKIERESRGDVRLERIELAEIPEFKRMLGWLIRSDLFPGKILARNETLYDVNRAAAMRIAQKQSWKTLSTSQRSRKR